MYFRVHKEKRENLAHLDQTDHRENKEQEGNPDNLGNQVNLVLTDNQEDQVCLD